ncbi:MAG: transketolase-like TK C-terminal-containing protein, partial [Chloroflexota bacterium]
MELPNLRSHEPAFAQELEWQMLEALQQCADRVNGKATYLRLSTKPIDQRLMQPALERIGEDELRRQVLRGGYRLVDAKHDAPDTDPRDTVQVVATGVMVPEAHEAVQMLHEEGIAANLINLTSSQLVYEDWISWRRMLMSLSADDPDPGAHIGMLIPESERRAPIVTVQDGASHSLAWIGSVYGAPVFSLGVDDFGQSGDIPSLYKHYEIDAEHIAEAAFSLLDLRDGV